jgi:hypothetical protein
MVMELLEANNRETSGGKSEDDFLCEPVGAKH